MEIEKKYGVYLCKGCGIGEAINFESLQKVIKKEGKIQFIKEHDIMCSPEARAMVLEDIKPEGEGINSLVIAACSPRVKYEELDFPNVLVERCNIRETVAWTQEPNNEHTQALAEDYLRMYCARMKKSDLPEPYQSECDKTILVIGGGAAGLSAALEAANDGYDVVLVEKEAELGGYAAKMFRQTPSSYPFTTLQEPTVFQKIKAVQGHPKVRVLTNATIEKIDGQPGLLDTTVTVNGVEETFRVGAVVLAAGFRPYDATKLTKLGYGLSKDVITNLEMEELAKQGKIMRPSDGKPAENVAFIQCAGSRDPEHLPYCSDFCCLASLKQALYVRQSNPNATAMILYKDIRTPGQSELFYKEAQSDPGVMLTKAEIDGRHPGRRRQAADCRQGHPPGRQCDLRSRPGGPGHRPGAGDQRRAGAQPRLPPGSRLAGDRGIRRLCRFQLHLLPVRDPAHRDLCRGHGAPGHDHSHGHERRHRRGLKGHPGRGARGRGHGGAPPGLGQYLPGPLHATLHLL